MQSRRRLLPIVLVVNFFTGAVFDYTSGKIDAALRGWPVRGGR